MYKGIVELEAMKNDDVLNDINVVKKYEEYHPEANTKYWHILKMEVPDVKIKLVTKKFSKVIKSDWFSIFWNDKKVFVVFSNKIFRLSREIVQTNNYQEVKNYGIKHGVQAEYMNLQKALNSW